MGSPDAKLQAFDPVLLLLFAWCLNHMRRHCVKRDGRTGKLSGLSKFVLSTLVLSLHVFLLDFSHCYCLTHFLLSFFKKTGPSACKAGAVPQSFS